MQSRRHFLKTIGAAGVGLGMFSKLGLRTAFAAANSQYLKKWIQPLRGLGPAGIPVLNAMPDPVFANTNFYQVTAGEYTDQLHPDMGPTRLWGYWDTTNPNPRHLGGVIVARRGTASRIRFTNTLAVTSRMAAQGQNHRVSTRGKLLCYTCGAIDLLP